MRARRSGFALPVALVLLTVMAAGAVTVLSWSSAEVRMLDNGRAETSAFAMAEAGLERYLARGRITPADTTIVLAAGRARVRATLLRRAATPADTAIYVIRSEGITAGGAAIPQGRRTVAQLAYHLPGRVRVRAAWTSLSGVEKTGGAGSISGVDVCSTDSIAGLSLPTGTFAQNSVGPGEYPIRGKPPIDERGTPAAMAAETDIHWVGIINPLGPALAPDVIICYPNTHGYDGRWAPCGSWPASASWSNPNYWPTIVINGSGPLPNDGRGTLVVTGDLTFGGGDTWDGLVLVGSRIVDNGNGALAGAVISGLNLLTGQSVAQSSKSSGPKDYDYDSCKLARAVQSHSRLAQIPNAWVDNWNAW